MINRRRALQLLASAPLASNAFARGVAAPRILLRACWQSYSMGEVAQTVGMLRLLQNEIPRAKITLWANSLENGVAAWLVQLFPKLTLMKGSVGRDGKPDQPALRAAWEQCGFLIHGPADNIVARGHLEAWRKHTGKPYGIYGVTLSSMTDKLKSLMTDARFVYFRDGLSRGEAMRKGLDGHRIGFAPDAAFAFDAVDSSAAKAWLQSAGTGKTPFICVVPKLRHTPYWEIFGRAPKYAEVTQAAENQRFQETDLKLLGDALSRLLEHNDFRILLCPEMPYQVALGNELFSKYVPEKFRRQCVVRDDVPTPDLAAGLFKQSKLVVSMELLSAVVAETVGTPAIHLRLPNDSNKGQMWRDVGLKDWVLERDEMKAAELSDAMLGVIGDQDRTEELMEGADKFIRKCHAESMAVVKASLK